MDATDVGGQRWLQAEAERLLEFGRDACHPAGGFAWLDSHGRPELSRPVELWITCRMTYTYALGQLLDFDGAAELVTHGLRALTGRLRDHDHGGWFAGVDTSGPTTASKGAYEHAFVVLAAGAAQVAGHTEAERLFLEALRVQDRHFWDEEHGAVVDTFLDRGFTELEAYRGANANMHTVEAYLMAADVSGEQRWLERAERIVNRLVHDQAGQHAWRMPEHYDPQWKPMLDYNRTEPLHPFRPYGATTGHGFEWARLSLHLEAALGGQRRQLREDAVALFDRATADGWAVDGRPGFVYTTDWDGTPVARNRLHWVVAEAINAAASLWRATGEDRYADRYRQWWAHAVEAFVDNDAGSWHHELDPANRPSAGVWSGKPDLYHALQATLVPRLPLAPSLAPALADGLLDAGV